MPINGMAVDENVSKGKYIRVVVINFIRKDCRILEKACES